MTHIPYFNHSTTHFHTCMLTTQECGSREENSGWFAKDFSFFSLAFSGKRRLHFYITQSREGFGAQQLEQQTFTGCNRLKLEVFVGYREEEERPQRSITGLVQTVFKCHRAFQGESFDCLCRSQLGLWYAQKKSMRLFTRLAYRVMLETLSFLVKMAINFPWFNQKHKILAHHKEKLSHMLSGWVVHLYYPRIITVIIDFLLLPRKEPQQIIQRSHPELQLLCRHQRCCVFSSLVSILYNKLSMNRNINILFYRVLTLRKVMALLILHIEKCIPTQKPAVRKQRTMESQLDKVLDYYPTQKTMKCVHFPEVQKKEDNTGSALIQGCCQETTKCIGHGISVHVHMPISDILGGNTSTVSLSWNLTSIGREPRYNRHEVTYISYSQDL